MKAGVRNVSVAATGCVKGRVLIVAPSSRKVAVARSIVLNAGSFARSRRYSVVVALISLPAAIGTVLAGSPNASMATTSLARTPELTDWVRSVYVAASQSWVPFTPRTSLAICI
ncbi:MAG: hypothetical protein BWY66_01381 [bacterium ADurb.Bin374]|nr:MAG: hypothetical protein BWY66_01381 [bacterium ADurb.Bin374]